MAPEPASLFQRQRRLIGLAGLALLVLSPLFFFRPLEDAYILPQRLAALLGLSLALLGLAPQSFNHSRVLLAALLFFAWRFFTQGISLGAPNSLPWVVSQMAPLATLILVAHAGRDAQWQGRLLRLALLSAGLVALYALVQVWGLDPGEGGAVDMGFLQRAHGSLGNPDFLAGFLVLTLPGLVLAWAGWPGSKRQAGLLLALTLLVLTALLLTQVRGAWLAALAGTGVALFAGRATVRWPRLVLLAALGLGLAFFFSWPGRLNPSGISPLARVQQTWSGDDAWAGRRFMARVGWDLLRSHPALGVGPGHFQDAYLEEQGRLLSQNAYGHEPYRFTADIHDDWLQTGAESGWPGFLLLLATLALACRTAWRRKTGVGAAALGLFAAFSVQALFHFPLGIQASALFFWGAIGLCAAWDDDGLPGREALPWAWLALPLALGIFLSGRQSLASAALNTGTTLKERRQAREAAPFLFKATQCWPQDARAWMRLGSLQDGAGDEQAAVESFERAAQAQPGLPEAWSNLALALGKLGRLDDAQAASEQSLSLNPRAAEAWSNLAKLRYMAGKPQMAIAELEGGLAQAGPSPLLYFNLGAVYFNLGQRAQARQAFQQCLALQPGHAEARRLLEKMRP